jgi:tetratricopeptide (TPR) repeat protein
MKYFGKIAVHCGAVAVAWVLVNCHVVVPVGAMGVKTGFALATSGDETRISPQARRHMDRGHELEKSQDFAGAAECYAMVVAVEPRSPEAHFRLAEALLNSGRLQSALLSYTVAITIDPRHVGALEGRSRLCSRLEFHRQALRDLGKLIELRPFNAEYHYLRGRTFLKLKSVRAAYFDFLRANELDKKYPRPTLVGDEMPVIKKVAALRPGSSA